ncbi:MAG: adenosylcobalamin-dependent ribonucleoside-diphosphate reductase [Candidatus Omnitrophica bacterium]|nr:adenosylcobalamin-dependent ribonucleoside-diphosphate reductase [Candidatus Omnitrophota bacterium]
MNGLKLTVNALKVLERRYLLKDDRRRVIETPDGLFRRVARHVAGAQDNFRRRTVSRREAEERFFGMMRSLEFMPNSPTLMNAGTKIAQLSACFVIPVPDSIPRIFGALKQMATIHQTGGGTGFDLSSLRPKGDLVYSTKGEASGAVSFMSIFDAATGVIVQGGRRRGANMGILRVDHPDILEFIRAKLREGAFANFNLSVAATDRFMRACYADGSYALINPRTKKESGRLKARKVFDLIVECAWKTGDPGMVFIDEINRHNPTPGVGSIAATNPCGELPLLPYESCNLASLNLSKFVDRGGKMNWHKLSERIRWGVRFLDNVIEVNKFPLPEIRKITFANRKIGLGVMGFADMLILLGIPYNSKVAIDFSCKLMRFMRQESLNASHNLARERGVFPNFTKSIYAKKNLKLRNAAVNTIAPTGTISIIAGCSSGIEPLFAISFTRNVLGGQKLLEANPVFERVARERKFYSASLMAEISRRGSIQKIKGIPGDVKNIFITAFDVRPSEHLYIQAAFQKYTDNSVSKTVNLPSQARPEDIRRIYLLAHKLRCKGITVYRYGTKKEQVLSFPGAGRKAKPVVASSVYSGGTCASEVCA